MNAPTRRPPGAHRAEWGKAGPRVILLALGGITGLVLAVSGLLRNPAHVSDTLPAGVIARVDDHLIPRKRYLQVVHDLATGKTGPVTEADRQFALQRLVDEELLVMRGIELGLAQSEPAVRKAVAASVIAQIAAEAEAGVPTEKELRRLYTSDPGFFTGADRYRVQWWRTIGTGRTAAENAATAYAWLRSGRALTVSMRANGMQRMTILPDDALTARKISDYMGPLLARRAEALAEGGFSEPTTFNGRTHILYLRERQAGVLPDFDTARPMLEAEFLRRKGDQALRNYLEWLRGRSEIWVAAEAPP